MKIVNQFRALKETRLIFDTYRFNGQKFAASVFNDCIVCADDKKAVGNVTQKCVCACQFAAKLSA